MEIDLDPECGREAGFDISKFSGNAVDSLVQIYTVKKKFFV
jgi:hypothetical protein